MHESVEISAVWYTNVNDIVLISCLRKGALQEVVFQSKTWDFSEPTGLLLTTVVFGTEQNRRYKSSHITYCDGGVANGNI